MTSAARRLSRVSTAIAIAFALAATPAFAAGYIKFDGVDGDVAGKGHGGEIHVESFSWGASQAGTGRGTGKMHMEDISAKPDTAARREKSSPTLSEVVVTKSTDSASPSAHGAGPPRRNWYAVARAAREDTIASCPFGPSGGTTLVTAPSRSADPAGTTASFGIARVSTRVPYRIVSPASDSSTTKALAA